MRRWARLHLSAENVVLLALVIGLGWTLWLLHSYAGKVDRLQAMVTTNAGKIGTLEADRAALQNQIINGGGVPVVPVLPIVPVPAGTTTTTLPRTALRVTSTTRPRDVSRSVTTTRPPAPRPTTTTRPPCTTLPIVGGCVP